MSTAPPIVCDLEAERGQAFRGGVENGERVFLPRHARTGPTTPKVNDLPTMMEG